MYNHLKFEVSRTNRIKTPCHCGYIDGYEGTIKKVGSYACHDCKDFVSVDLDRLEVECNADTPR